MADPHEIVDILLFDRNAGPNAGMDKQKIAAAETVAEALQEQIVRARKNTAKAPLQVGFCLKPRARANPIGCKSLHAAELPPMTEEVGVSKKIFQHGFMVATQAHRTIFNQPNGQQINHRLRIRTAIDVIAQINFDRVLYRPTSKVIFNARDGLHQQVGPAVDVADSIDSRICRRRSGNRSRVGGRRWSHCPRSSTTEPSGGQMMAKRASRGRHAWFILEKQQTDQSNDRDPGDRIGDDKAIPEFCGRTDHAVPARSSPYVLRSSASPWKKFSETNDSSAAVVSTF